MYSALSIANYFIERGLIDEKEITPMKLQKLLYFAHGWHLAFFDKPLLKEEIQAWAYGPVVPSIYHIFKRFGNTPITVDIPEGTEEINPQTDTFLDFIWSMYKNHSPIHLSNITHLEGSPWDVIRQENENALFHGVPIGNELIKSYFQEAQKS